MVSHDSGLLNDVCNHIIEISDLKLGIYKGNLASFVKIRPEARARGPARLPIGTFRQYFLGARRATAECLCLVQF
jgi:ATPase subunit of ABC transporter with duplicated ATPase domains